MIVCVLSNIDRTDIGAASPLHGLVTSDGAKAYKPRPKMFRFCLGLLWLDASDALHSPCWRLPFG